jgi:hypothetical protein
MLRALPAVLLALAALASGCAGSASSAGDFQGEERRVADVVEKIQSAGQTGDAREICEQVLAKRLRDQIADAGSNCEQEIDKAIDDADDFELDVEAVTITGNTATAKVKGEDRGEERVRDFEFVREGSSWRATNLGS